ncbi:tRNA isopentenyltransferase [Terfezia boudieri ATCC MYA-4762]|uniref:tRNA dimethylallyltransferase n=1 Tax=Terfezia boudieri ATCC MYA-4762 TaxID=1051890 RepID=A0A3N4LSZ4_9PEZI|nr:tRNA isopentenyltransferase [Terfezia boudieri ATCC MYA-4762]
MLSAHNALRPLITVIGATGTGKSQVLIYYPICNLLHLLQLTHQQLAVDLARSLNGEIINADAMQMYDGLPIITNKMTLGERQGVPHHFLGTVPRGEDIRVGIWEEGVRRVIEEIWGRGRLPIIVGGTHYYIQALLYPRSLLPDASPPEPGKEGKMSGEELARKYPILNAETSEILQKLQEVDPVMAARWHPNDHRKIRRSLEIYYLHGGTPASEIYRLQKLSEKKEESRDESIDKVARFRNLIFWVHADPEILNKRLGDRVDKMVSEGLFDEIEELWKWYLNLKEGEKEVDLERGVWQSIGFKEFLPWLQARQEAESGEFKDGGKVAGEGERVVVGGEVRERLESLRKEGLERMKIGTVQYARTQVKWIRIKLMNAMRDANEGEEEVVAVMEDREGEKGNRNGKEELQQCEASSKDTPTTDSARTTTEKSQPKQPSNILYLLDSSDIPLFAENVSNPAISIAKSFFSPFNPDFRPLPDPLSLSSLAASCLKPKRDYDLSKRPDLWVKRMCEVCGITTVDEESWKKHEGSGKHKRKVSGRGKWEEAQNWKKRRERGEVAGDGNGAGGRG